MIQDQNFLRYLQGAYQGFNPFGVGNKVYGSGRSAPNVGPTTKPDAYMQRDNVGAQKRNAMLRRLKARQRGKYMSSDSLTPIKGDYRAG